MKELVVGKEEVRGELFRETPLAEPHDSKSVNPASIIMEGDNTTPKGKLWGYSPIFYNGFITHRGSSFSSS